MRARIDVHAVEMLESYLASMGHRIQNFSAPLTDGIRIAEREIRDAFPTGGASVGQDWPQHSQSTIDRWGNHSFGQGPTGNLLRSFRIFVRPFVAGVENVAPHAHLFENDRHGLASLGSGGTQIKIRHSPSTPANVVQVGREFMVITEATQQKMIDFILDYAVREAA